MILKILAAALWTFLVIEAKELIDLFSNFPGLRKLIDDGLINLVVSLLLIQVEPLSFGWPLHTWVTCQD